MNMNKPIALTPGKEEGIGPELMLKALNDNSLKSQTFYWCGDKASLKLASSRSQISVHFKTGEAEIHGKKKLIFLSDCPFHTTLERQAWFLAEAARLGLEGQISAVVTGPIEKAALAFLGEGLVGQTEYFASQWGKENRKPFMAFMGGPFLLTLMTTHIPLSEVPRRMSVVFVHDYIIELYESLPSILRKKSKDIAIDMLGLNPHAGEQGLLGNEERDIIIPAITALRNQGYNVTGPWPADGYFAYFEEKKSRPDVVVALYHDQGLAPYKLMSKGKAVNLTLGLRIPRLSPAHGTADHLAGKNLASYQSTLKAIELAENMVAS